MRAFCALNSKEKTNNLGVVPSKARRGSPLPSAAAPYGRNNALLTLKLKASFEQ